MASLRVSTSIASTPHHYPTTGSSTSFLDYLNSSYTLQYQLQQQQQHQQLPRYSDVNPTIHAHQNNNSNSTTLPRGGSRSRTRTTSFSPSSSHSIASCFSASKHKKGVTITHGNNASTHQPTTISPYINGAQTSFSHKNSKRSSLAAVISYNHPSTTKSSMQPSRPTSSLQQQQTWSPASSSSKGSSQLLINTWKPFYYAATQKTSPSHMSLNQSTHHSRSHSRTNTGLMHTATATITTTTNNSAASSAAKSHSKPMKSSIEPQRISFSSASRLKTDGNVLRNEKKAGEQSKSKQNMKRQANRPHSSATVHANTFKQPTQTTRNSLTLNATTISHRKRKSSQAENLSLQLSKQQHFHTLPSTRYSAAITNATVDEEFTCNPPPHIDSDFRSLESEKTLQGNLSKNKVITLTLSKAKLQNYMTSIHSTTIGCNSATSGRTRSTECVDSLREQQQQLNSHLSLQNQQQALSNQQKKQQQHHQQQQQQSSSNVSSSSKPQQQVKASKIAAQMHVLEGRIQENNENNQGRNSAKAGGGPMVLRVSFQDENNNQQATLMNSRNLEKSEVFQYSIDKDSSIRKSLDKLSSIVQPTSSLRYKPFEQYTAPSPINNATTKFIPRIPVDGSKNDAKKKQKTTPMQTYLDDMESLREYKHYVNGNEAFVANLKHPYFVNIAAKVDSRNKSTTEQQKPAAITSSSNQTIKSWKEAMAQRMQLVTHSVEQKARTQLQLSNWLAYQS